MTLQKITTEISTIQESISTFLDENLNKQKELLSKHLYEQVKNKLIPQLNGEELFTPNYGKSFFDDFMKYYKDNPLHTSCPLPRLPAFQHMLSEDEYIIGLCGFISLTRVEARANYRANFMCCHLDYLKLNLLVAQYR